MSYNIIFDNNFDMDIMFFRQDVEFEFEDIGFAMIGSDFEVKLKINNTSEYSRTAVGYIGILTKFYTGKIHKVVKSERFEDVKLSPKTCKLIIKNILINHLPVSTTSFILQTGHLPRKIEENIFDANMLLNHAHARASVIFKIGKVKASKYLIKISKSEL